MQFFDMALMNEEKLEYATNTFINQMFEYKIKFSFHESIKFPTRKFKTKRLNHLSSTIVLLEWNKINSLSFLYR